MGTRDLLSLNCKNEEEEMLADPFITTALFVGSISHQQGKWSMFKPPSVAVSAKCPFVRRIGATQELEDLRVVLMSI